MDAAYLAPQGLAAGLRVARRQRVADFAHVAETSRRLPTELVPLLAGVYVIDEGGAALTREHVVELRRTIRAWSGSTLHGSWATAATRSSASARAPCTDSA